jgi:uncharacterized protein (DUF58 family)
MAFQPPDRFLRPNRPDPGGVVTIGPRTIYILPTRYGLIFGLLLLLLLFGSLNYGNNPAFLLTFLLTGLGLVAMLHTWRNLVGVELAPSRCEPVFAGQEACFEIRLMNRRRGSRPAIRLQVGNDPAASADLEDQPVLLRLARPATRRGILKLGRVTAATRYPLGLLQAWCYLDLDADCLVYPAPSADMPPSDHPDYLHSASGDKGVGVDDFVGIRPYRPGDSPRQLHWKALARGQALQTKQFGGDRSDRLWLDWDTLTGLGTEARLGRLCRGILSACEQQREFGLRLPGKEIPPGRGPAHRNACLAALALFEEPR